MSDSKPENTIPPIDQVSAKIVSETGLDHSLYLWNSVGKRAQEEMPKDYLFKSLMELQINSCIQLVLETLWLTKETIMLVTKEPVDLNDLVVSFQNALIERIRDRVKQERKNMN